MDRVFLKAILIAFFGVFVGVLPAKSQATRTWVSGVGDDANACSRTAPCKTFAGAISKTAAGGEINCLDPGGFGGVTITKAIAIICQAGTAGVLVAGSNGITVNAGATDVVSLIGLDIEGLGTGLSGVQVIGAAAVHVISSVIRGFASGINVVPSAGIISVDVVDTVVADGTGQGIVSKPTGSGSVKMMVDRSRILRNSTDGLMANGTTTTGTLNVTVRDSESVGNGADGFVAFSSGASTQIMIDSSISSHNANRGINASGTGTIVRFSRSAISGNTTGVNQVGLGIAASYSTNSVDGNGVDGTFVTTPQK